MIGFLRNSDVREKKVLQLLSDNLPKEFIVYVETRYTKSEIFDIRFCGINELWGFVLEVKDWVALEAEPRHMGLLLKQRWHHSPRAKPL